MLTRKHIEDRHKELLEIHRWCEQEREKLFDIEGDETPYCEEFCSDYGIPKDLDYVGQPARSRAEGFLANRIMTAIDNCAKECAVDHKTLQEWLWRNE